MTKPEPMDAQQAVGILKAATRKVIYECACPDDCSGCEQRRAALAALEGMHIYASRFAENDPVSYLMHTQQGWEVHGPSRWSTDFLCIESDCFPTREAAEAECKRRKEKGA